MSKNSRLFTATPGLSRHAFAPEQSLHGLIGEKHHGGGAKPIPLLHTDTAMSAANACLPELLSSTTEKAST